MGEIRLSCCAAPWGSEGIVQAVTDAAECGYEGLEFPSEVVQRFEDRLHVFEEILNTTGIKLSSLFQYVNLVDKDKVDEQVERAANSARFAGATGSGSLVVCHSEPLAREPSDDEWFTACAIVEEIGSRCQDFGIKLRFMPKAMHFGGSEKDVKRFMASTDPNMVGLAMDTAEFTLAGIGIEKTLKTYGDRVGEVRFRDVSGAKRRADATSSKPGTAPQFGRGAVKFEAVVKALTDVNYEGWVTVDISGEGASPKDAAMSANRFIMRRSGLYPY